MEATTAATKANASGGVAAGWWLDGITGDALGERVIKTTKAKGKGGDKSE
jgi:hypothetical protein